MRAGFARFMRRVENDTNENDFINSLAVDNDSDSGTEPAMEEIAPNAEEPNKNNNTVSPYSSSNLESTVEPPIKFTKDRKHTIYEKPMKTIDQVESLQVLTTVDSGATHDMTGIKAIFEEIFPLINENGNKPIALLGDNTMACVIEGHGYATYKIEGYPI